MHFDPKPISPEGVPAALEKAHRYRLLNEPADAESICLDVLAVDPDNQQALETLVLAITDQFDREMGVGVRRAREVVPRLDDEYRRDYYAGIICERHAMAQLRRGAPGASEAAYGAFRDAMAWYEKAEALRPAGNDDAILRWNSCARALARNPALAPSTAEAYEPSFD
jgi:tetratricopeptide (TPR) repeat protein